MSENNSAKPDSSPDQRHFDWGPPANNTADGLKEWVVYLVILILLGGGVWVLLDINGQKSGITVAPVPVKPAVSNKQTMPAGENSALIENTIAQPVTQFFVQLGAFADEASAREVFNQLVADGFSPTLAEPDQQYEIYRILVGPFASEKEAEDKAQKLNELEFHCFVIEAP